MSEVTAWILYSIVIANLLGLAAVAGESALRDAGKSGRWAWVAAMMGSVALPVLAWLGLSVRAVPAVSESALIPVIPLPPVVPVVQVPGAVPDGAGLDGDVLLLVLWAAVTGLALIYLGLSWAAILRERRHWRRISVGGVRVALTPDVGPAAWGVRRPEILMPEWAIELESRVRRLMVLHEGEHVRAGDTRVVLLGLLTLAAAPWNLPLWWQFRRLRQAIELDCDARVLRRAPDARRYGTLLLEVGRRRAAPVMAVALADPPSFLERRIRLITSRAKIVSVRRVAGLGLVAAALVTVAVCTRDPLAAELDPIAALNREAGAPRFTPFTRAPQLQNISEVQRQLEARYPVALREAGIGGSTDVWFYIGETGTVLKTQLQGSSGHPALDDAALDVAGLMEFSPAYNGDRAVKVWVSMPIAFRSASVAARQVPEEQPAREAETGRLDAPLAGRSEVSHDARDRQAGSGAVDTDVGLRLSALGEDRAFEADEPAIDARMRAARLRNAPDGAPEASVSRGTVRPQTTRTAAVEPHGTTELTAARMLRATTHVVEQAFAEASAAPAEPATSQPRLENLSEVQELIAQEYPPLLRDAGIGGTAIVRALVGADGRIERTEIDRGTGQAALDEAAVRVARAMVFSPARNGGDAVAVWVSLPIGFVSR